MYTYAHREIKYCNLMWLEKNNRLSEINLVKVCDSLDPCFVSAESKHEGTAGKQERINISWLDTIRLLKTHLIILITYFKGVP